jgi:hypothetical protein
MVAHVQPHHPLAVTFTRDNEPVERLYARDGEHAWAHAIALISQHEELQHGDTLTVLRIGAPEEAR